MNRFSLVRMWGIGLDATHLHRTMIAFCVFAFMAEASAAEPPTSNVDREVVSQSSETPQPTGVRKRTEQLGQAAVDVFDPALGAIRGRVGVLTRSIVPGSEQRVPTFEGLRAACTVNNMQGGIAGGFLNWSAPGEVLAVYVDPAGSAPGCGNPNPYPFLINSVQIPTFADASIFGLSGEGLGTLEFSVGIRCPNTGGDPCSQPDGELFRSANQTLVANDSGFYSFTVPVNICVEGPFYVLIHFESWTGNPARTPTPLWDTIARPLCRQYVSSNNALTWQDFTTFFTDGATSWVDININGSTNDACVPGGNCGGAIAVCGNDVQEGQETCDGTDDLACPGECLSDCTCPPTGSCCVSDTCVDTVTRSVCSNGLGGVWHELGVCPDFPCVLPVCDFDTYDNGPIGGSGQRPSVGWDDTGIIDDFTIPQGNGTEFSCIQLTMIDSTGLAAFDTARIRIYSLPAGGIPNLGNFGTEVPVYDRTFADVTGNLLRTDTGANIGAFDVITIDLFSTPFDLGAGDFGLLVTFPGTGAQNFWITSTPNIVNDFAHIWGAQATFPSALTDHFAFTLKGQTTPGACCDDLAAVCSNGVLIDECPPGSRFESGLTCDQIVPMCGDLPGACCDGIAGTCSDGVLESLCPVSSSFYALTACEDLQPPCGTGGCCLDDVCTLLPFGECDILGGVFLGSGVDCTSNGCIGISTTGVCCMPDDSCGPTPQGACRGSGGTFHPNGATCSDADSNGVADICENDCNTNGVLDNLDISRGNTPDCNLNGVPDNCDLLSGFSRDCNTNGTLDDCEPSTPWVVEASCFTSPGGGIPPGCDCSDADGDGDVDLADFGVYQREIRDFNNVYLTNGTGGGDWFDPATWDQNAVPASARDYDLAMILPGDTVTQDAPMVFTLGYYLLEEGAIHIIGSNGLQEGEIAALTVEAYGQLISSNGAGTITDPGVNGEASVSLGRVVVRNAVDVLVAGTIEIVRTFDPNYCTLVDNAPVPFDDLGPCVPPSARTGSRPDDDGQNARFVQDTTHRALSEIAADNNQCVLHDFLVNELLLPDGIDTTATGTGATLTDATAATQTYRDWIVDGGQTEDMPGTRSLRHFLNPIGDDPLFGTNDDARTWAIDGGNNDWSFTDGRGFYFQALTAVSQADRDAAFASTFRSLGQVVHLLADMGSTPHTRDDAHPPFFDESPFENVYVRANYGTVPQMNGLAGVGTVPPAANPPRYTLGIAPPGFNNIGDFWDTDQYIGQAVFTFGSQPGLAEFTNYNFFSGDTVFDFGNGNTHPSHADTNVATLFPLAGASRQIFIPSDTGNTGAGWVDVAKTTPASVGIVPLTRVARARNLGIARSRNYYRSRTGSPRRIRVSMNNNNVMEEYSQILLPQTIAHATGVINYFFRGKVSISLTWSETQQQYTLGITNQSGETLGAGTWQLYQDDASDNRSIIAADFSAYVGTLAQGASFNATFAATNRPGRYMLVFQGTIGNEIDTAVIGRVFDIVRVSMTWDPNSDQDLYMWGPDGSLIAYFSLSSTFGQLDIDDIGGTGPENITLKQLSQEGEYVFMINYFRDWWQEQFFDTDTMTCLDNTPDPLNSPDNVTDQCYTQTDIDITVETFHNASAAVRTQVLTLSTPNLGAAIPGATTPEGMVSGSWWVAQVVSVDADGNVTVQGAP
ncbi:MAG: hypothetical protein GXP29_15190 [Planctomycetes bacterium]|nr:hypothetical protein [Planctomycetota bacterium]